MKRVIEQKERGFCGPKRLNGVAHCDHCDRPWSWIRVMPDRITRRLCMTHGRDSYIAESGGQFESLVSPAPVSEYHVREPWQ